MPRPRPQQSHLVSPMASGYRGPADSHTQSRKLSLSAPGQTANQHRGIAGRLTVYQTIWGHSTPVTWAWIRNFSYLNTWPNYLDSWFMGGKICEIIQNIYNLIWLFSRANWIYKTDLIRKSLLPQVVSPWRLFHIETRTSIKSESKINTHN